MNPEVVESVRAAGVVGAGGAGFPTHIKLASTAEYILINGAECEPLLRVDQQLIPAQIKQFIKGIEAFLEATGAAKAIVALKEKYTAAKIALEGELAGKPIEIFTLADFFPAGDEQVLVYEVLGRVVPPGGIPLNVGCVVCNVETVINVAEALEGRPVIEKYVTITGEVTKPVTLKVLIGTPIVEVLALVGVNDDGSHRVINGGPMMGEPILDWSEPITKTTKGLIVLSKAHQLIEKKQLDFGTIVKRSKSACIQCVRCTDVCPRNLLGHPLEPHKIMRALNYLKTDEKALTDVFLCCECGACELYGCIMDLSPRQVNAELKRELAGKGLRVSAELKAKGVSELRKYRKIPSKRLIKKLGLADYDRPAPIIDNDYLPEKVFLSLKQHIGAKSLPVVKLGQEVKKGELIAGIAENSLGANIHASLTGIVEEIKDDLIVIKSQPERSAEQ